MSVHPPLVYWGNSMGTVRPELHVRSPSDGARVAEPCLHIDARLEIDITGR
jgi:hypothetical protein